MSMERFLVGRTNGRPGRRTQRAWRAVGILAVFALWAGSLLAGPPKKGGGKAGAERVVAGDLGRELDAYMQDRTRFPDGFSGCVLVAKGGKPILCAGYGIADSKKQIPMAPDALFDWCSVTKQFTAAAILKLEMMKKLSLEDPLGKLWKDVPKDKEKVKLRHLLNHTSGIAPDAKAFGQAEANDRAALVKWYLAGAVVSEPGEKWEYSNAAYFVLAALIEQKSGTTYEKFLRDQLFVPAGMRDTRIIGDPDLDLARVPLDARGSGVPFAYGTGLSWGYRGAGGVVAPVADMLAWDRALRGEKVLNATAKKRYVEVGKEEYALGIEVKNLDGVTAYTHSGHTGQVVTYYLRCVEPEIVIAIAQTEEPKLHPANLARELLRVAK